MRSEDEKWYAAGQNICGQLGIGHTDFRVSNFTEVTGVWGNIVAVECGECHTFMRTEHGKWYATGRNGEGQLGLGHTNNVCAFEEVASDSGNIAKIICGSNHIFLSKE